MFPNTPFPEPRSSFEEPVIPPSSDPDEGGLISVYFSPVWVPYALGALTQLTQLTTWVGDDDEKRLAVDRATLLLNMIGQPLVSVPGAGPGIPPMVRYNPTLHRVESSTDGGTTWTPAPGADPRLNSPLPPQTGSNADCNSAASERSYLDRFASMLSLNLGTAVTATGLGYSIIGMLIELSGSFAIIADVAIAAALGLISAGLTAVAVALSITNLDLVECILFCHTRNGQLTADAFAQVQSDITTLIGGTDATIINLLLSLQGYGGINDAYALALNSGVCTGCGCDWCFEWDMTVANGGWEAYFDTSRNVNRGTWTPGGWRATYLPPPGSESTELMIRKLFSGTVTDIEVTYTRTMGVGAGAATDQYVRDSANGFYNGTVFGTNVATSGTRTWTLTGTWTIATELTLWMFAALRTTGTGNPGGSLTVTKIRLKGTGSNPFGNDNC